MTKLTKEQMQERNDTIPREINSREDFLKFAGAVYDAYEFVPGRHQAMIFLTPTSFNDPENGEHVNCSCQATSGFGSDIGHHHMLLQFITNQPVLRDIVARFQHAMIAEQAISGPGPQRQGLSIARTMPPGGIPRA